ncbi:NtaA/DmoA family FMN-dependent monooxygenase [Pseudoxanthobacter sp.]|uniref:NtaA/DmoA family FMN-dependent monooxygenase n=1 Tax=Pseudoxanthobacter sp. TaxID=1925742 RepID=UPI002FE05191
MPKSEIILNAFTMNAVSHVNYGLWRHDEDQAFRHDDLDYWIGLAEVLEEGGFDAVFIADALGLLDTYGGGAAESLRRGVQSPLSDPLLLVSALAGASRHLGIGVTVSTTYEQPYLLARKFTTLDQLSGGRVAWNIVTSQLESAARNLGLERQVDHDERYDRADEFLTVAYKLWQGSWEDDAVVADKGSAARPDGLYADPARVHAIDHHGRFFRVPGPHIAQPSPQRVPVLFQAGGSPRGQRFAARHAELVFVAGADAAGVRRNVETIRALAREEGRAPDAIRFVSAVAVVVAPTRAEAESRFADYRRFYDATGALVHYSASTGVDFSDADQDAPIRYLETNSNRSLLRMFDDPDGGRSWTLRQALAPEGGFGRTRTFVGDPIAVADGLEDWLEATGTDGINLIHVVSPGSFVDFSRLVVPELIRRGRRPAGRPEVPLTLRERLFGAAPRPPVDHPAARHGFPHRAATSEARPE